MYLLRRIYLICNYWCLFSDFCSVARAKQPLWSSLEHQHRLEEQDSNPGPACQALADSWAPVTNRSLRLGLSFPHDARHTCVCAPVFQLLYGSLIYISSLAQITTGISQWPSADFCNHLPQMCQKSLQFVHCFLFQPIPG